MKEFFGRLGGNTKARDEHEGGLGMHSEDLFDQDEDASGEVADLATGQRFNNSSAESVNEKLTEVEGGRTDDALPSLEEDDDAAAKWLREHAEI